MTPPINRMALQLAHKSLKCNRSRWPPLIHKLLFRCTSSNCNGSVVGGGARTFLAAATWAAQDRQQNQSAFPFRGCCGQECPRSVPPVTEALAAVLILFRDLGNGIVFKS